MDIATTARRFLDAHRSGAMLDAPLSAAPEGFSLDDAYAVEAEIRRMRAEEGHTPVGLKVGYANKAVWRALKLDTLVWASMYGDTVHLVPDGQASLALPHYRSPKIEPEVVVQLKSSVPEGAADAESVLGAIGSIAIGFEIIDCPYPEWKFQPADFVASLGLHTALIVGDPLIVEAARIPELAAALASFKLKLLKNGEVVDEGAGKNSLRSPALCVAELATALRKRPGSGKLEEGDFISTGTLTTGQPVARGETWRVQLEGLPVQELSLRFE